MSEVVKLIIAMCTINGPTSSTAESIRNQQSYCQKPKLECVMEVGYGEYIKQMKCLTK